MISSFDHTIIECHDILKDKLNAVPGNIQDKTYSVFHIDEIDLIVSLEDGVFIIQMLIKDLASFCYRHQMVTPLGCQTVQMLQGMIPKLRNKAQTGRMEKNLEAMATLIDNESWGKPHLGQWRRNMPYPEIL